MTTVFILFVRCLLLRLDGCRTRCPDTIMPSRQRYSKKSFFRGLGLRYRTLFYEKLRRAADAVPKMRYTACRAWHRGRVPDGCVRHIIGPLASRREAFATFGRHRPHKFCRYDFMGDICLQEISMSCFISPRAASMRQVIAWQEPCCAPRDGMRDVAAADKAHKAHKADRRIRRICPRNGMKTLCGTI